MIQKLVIQKIKMAFFETQCKLIRATVTVQICFYASNMVSKFVHVSQVLKIYLHIYF